MSGSWQKEMLIDFRRNINVLGVVIKRTEVKRMETFKCLGGHV